MIMGNNFFFAFWKYKVSVCNSDGMEKSQEVRWPEWRSGDGYIVILCEKLKIPPVRLTYDAAPAMCARHFSPFKKLTKGSRDGFPIHAFTLPFAWETSEEAYRWERFTTFGRAINCYARTDLCADIVVLKYTNVPLIGLSPSVRVL